MGNNNVYANSDLILAVCFALFGIFNSIVFIINLGNAEFPLVDNYLMGIMQGFLIGNLSYMVYSYLRCRNYGKAK